MSTEINWPRLVAQGRVKAIGIQWTKEELEAIKSGVSPDDVRAGLFTPEEVAEAAEEQKKAGVIGSQDNPITIKFLRGAKKDVLIKIAKDFGIKIADENAVTRADLILIIQEKQEEIAKSAEPLNLNPESESEKAE